MKYFLIAKTNGERTEVTRERALQTLFGSYKNNAEVESWLDTPQDINCMFRIIEVREG